MKYKIKSGGRQVGKKYETKSPKDTNPMDWVVKGIIILIIAILASGAIIFLWR